MPEFLNIPLFDSEDFWDLIVRSIFNLVVIIYLTRVLYYKVSPRKDYLFTFILLSQVIFFILFLVENVNVDFGFAIGMFAVFGVIRYRTRQIPPREMTYLFLVIGISVINGLSNRRVSYAELLFANVAFLAITYLLERVFLLKNELKKEITFDNLELIKPERREELIKVLEEHTGLVIHKVGVGRIDLVRKTARIYIYYFSKNDSEEALEDNPV